MLALTIFVATHFLERMTLKAPSTDLQRRSSSIRRLQRLTEVAGRLGYKKEGQTNCGHQLEAIRLDPEDTDSHANRGIAWERE